MKKLFISAVLMCFGLLLYVNDTISVTELETSYKGKVSLSVKKAFINGERVNYSNISVQPIVETVNYNINKYSKVILFND